MPGKPTTEANSRCRLRGTHATEEGILSSQGVALMAHLLLYEDLAMEHLPTYIESELGLVIDCHWQQAVQCDAMETLHAVSTALLRNRRMSDLLVDCVNFSGDVDSVAAIALGLASLSADYEADIPTVLRNSLESGSYGMDFLIRKDQQLAMKFPALQKRLQPVSAGRLECGRRPHHPDPPEQIPEQPD
ncbi:ADP-ribosylglycohydrolase family protein [Parachitinimonas caeni]